MLFVKELFSLAGKLGLNIIKKRVTIQEAKIKQSENWENIAQQNSASSWKDEWLTILFSIPLIMCFIPALVPYVKAGFVVLEEMPKWYQYLLSVIVAASFGVRSAIGIIGKKK